MYYQNNITNFDYVGEANKDKITYTQVEDFFKFLEDGLLTMYLAMMSLPISYSGLEQYLKACIKM